MVIGELENLLKERSRMSLAEAWTYTCASPTIWTRSACGALRPLSEEVSTPLTHLCVEIHYATLTFLTNGIFPVNPQILLDSLGNQSAGADMATIEKRSNTNGQIRYRVMIRLKGNPVKRATFAKLSDARAWAIQTEAAIREARYFKIPEARRRTLNELITRYQKEILPYKSDSLSFVRGQHNQLEWWKKQLGDYFLCDITASRIAEARSKLTVSSSTANRYMAAISHVFSIAVRQWEWLDDSPTRKLMKLREPRGRVRYLSDEERNALLEAAAKGNNEVLHLVIVLALSTGARKGELLNLEWKDIDFHRRSMIFQHTKNGERRSAFLGEFAFQLLNTYKNKSLYPATYVFPSSRGTPIRIDRDFRLLLEQVGIENFRFHDLRHSAASYLAMSGASMTDIAEVLGHKTLSMVKRYTHLSNSHITKVVEKMNSHIF